MPGCNSNLLALLHIPILRSLLISNPASFFCRAHGMEWNDALAVEADPLCPSALTPCPTQHCPCPPYRQHLNGARACKQQRTITIVVGQSITKGGRGCQAQSFPWRLQRLRGLTLQKINGIFGSPCEGGGYKPKAIQSLKKRSQPLVG